VSGRGATTVRRAAAAELEAHAHVLRRVTFGPFPGGVEASVAAHRKVADLVEAQVAADPLPFEPPESIDRPFKIGDQRVFLSEHITNAGLVRFWIERMASDEAGLHERMVWFWHTLFTTSGKMGTDLFLWRQLRMVHGHAMGNLRDLAKGYVLDPAMMQFLNSDTSLVENPNENLARELMELFLMGRGNYTEEDVRAGALGLAGWTIDFERCVAVPRDAYGGVATFLGERRRWEPDALVDKILTHPSVARHVVGKLWRYFIGGTRDEDLVDRWARSFRASDYEIAPLVRTMLLSDAFLAARRSRPRSGVEWLAPVLRALPPQGADAQWQALEPTPVEQLGQLPYFPPNVAGWPDDSEWLSSSTGFTRASYVSWLPVRLALPDTDDLVAAALARGGIYEPSAETSAGLARYAEELRGTRAARYAALVKAVVLTPEFLLA
jgi:uncharacterized protein (DUF1800 family)